MALDSKTKDNILWTPDIEDSIDMSFIQRIQMEITQSCALPFALPVERIPAYIIQASQWFFENVDSAVEERMYIIPNSEICKPNGQNKINKIIKIPNQIMSIHGVYKLQDQIDMGQAGDFSMERMMMSTYSLTGGVGSTGVSGSMYNLTDMTMSMYEISTFNQYTNPPITYNFNTYSHKLVLMGELGTSNLCISCMKRLRLQDLYNNYYFFRLCVCFVKRALGTIYSTFEFTMPGGVTFNASQFKDESDSEIDEIKEWNDNNRCADYFFMSNTI